MVFLLRKLRKRRAVYYLIFFGILAIVLLIVFFLRSDLTGRAVLSVSAPLEGNDVDGIFKLDPAYIGNSIPLKAAVVAVYSGSIKSLYIEDLLSQDDISKNSKPNLLFAPRVVATFVYYPDSWVVNPSNSNSKDNEPIYVPPAQGGGGLPSGGSGGIAGGGISGHAVSDSSEPFSMSVSLKYGYPASLSIYEGYNPKVSSVTLRGVPININYVSLIESSGTLTASTSYYEFVQGISIDSPPYFFNLKKFGLIAKESGPISLRLVYLGDDFFSTESYVRVKNIKRLTFEDDRVLVKSEEVPSEAVVSSDSKARVVAVGPTITPDLLAAGCSVYTCSLPSECSVPPLETLNRGVLVPVQKSYCKYTDCVVSFQITRQCQLPGDEVFIESVDKADLGLSDDFSSSSGGGGSVALVDRDNSPKVVITSHEGTPRKDFTFLQSPPNFGDLCKNGVLDSGEEEVDCGGSCMSCSITYPDYSVPALGLSAGLLGLLFFMLLFRSRSGI